MSRATAGDPELSTDEGRRPGRASLALRPFGYLLIGVVWLAIWLIAVLLLVGSVPFLAYGGSDGLIEGVGDRLSNPVEAVLLIVVLLPILALAIGAGGWYVLTASWPLCVLSFTYVLRALNPSYAREKLSFTTRGAWGSTLGPPALSGVALSLQPVRATPFTGRVMRFYTAGWSVSGRMILAMMPAGLAWVTAIGTLAPEVSEVLHTVFGALTVLLLGASWTLGVRVFRGGGPGTDEPGRDENHGGLSTMSAEQRARRMRELKKQREKRLRKQ